MSKSIMQTEKECYITGARVNLHRHHVFGGGNRQNSEVWGCWVWLRADYHNMSNYGVHADNALSLRIKRETQERFEQLYGHTKFMEIFGKSYI